MYQHPLVTLASMNDAGLSFRVQHLAPGLRWPVHSAQGIPAPEVSRGFMRVPTSTSNCPYTLFAHPPTQ